jgi:hypothetical protein
MTAPGLGAWSLDISYDPAVVTPVGCTPQNGSVCNPNFAAGTVRVSGASGAGLDGDTSLALINFQCADAEGSTALTINVVELADGTPGDPQPIDETIVNGTITCQAGPPADTVQIGSGSAHVGQSGSVELGVVDIGEPGLGAWTIDITYDSSIVSASSCTADEGGVCNPAFADDTVRVTGANIDGVAGDARLGTITFLCDEAGSSALALTVQVLVDSTVGSPQAVTATVINGTFTCSEEAVAGVTPTPTVAFPEAGSGPSDGLGTSGVQTWLIAGLIGAGIAWLLAGAAGVSFVAAANSNIVRTLRPLGRAETFAPRLRPRDPSSDDANGRPTGRSWFVRTRDDHKDGGPQ